MPAAHHQLESRRTLVFLAALVALGPLSIDMYLPAMPAMRRAFDSDIAGMHLTVSAYLWGFALFHLACGPLADRYGRRPVLLGGTALFIIASLACALSSNVLELTIARFVQGIGACVGPTLARTITRDVYGPTRAARALSLIALLMALAPAIAPGLGGIMLRYVPWPSIFLFLGAYGALILWLVWRRLPETLPAPQSLHPRRLAANTLILLLHPSFVAVCLLGGLMYAGMMVYLASSGFVFIDMLGVATEWFGLIFLTSVFGYMSGSALSAQLSNRLSSERIMLLGSLTALLGTATMLVAFYLRPTSVLALVLPMTLFALALGLVLPHAMAIALRPFPLLAGTASSLFGFLQMGLSAVITAGVGRVLADSPQPLIVSMLGISLAATVIAVWLALRGSTEEATQRSASDAAHSAFPSSSQHGETRP
jgi:DHA1 family bicyclomycin/chloramphenicol resistance-like MFS transporter